MQTKTILLMFKKQKKKNLIDTIADGCFRFEMDKVGQYFGGGCATCDWKQSFKN